MFNAGKVHRGFWKSFISILPELTGTLDKMVNRRVGMVLCTGHSLGGAMATFGEQPFHTVLSLCYCVLQ